MENISWLGHASFLFTDTISKQNIYIDPFNLTQTNLPPADLIFVTHAHYDHCSPTDIQKIIKNDTIVVAPPDCLEKLNLPENQKHAVIPNNSYTVKNISFQTIPAYNVDEEKLKYHPKLNRWVGYILTVNNQKLYHPGDTDYVPEMNSLRSLSLDVAMLPIGGTYTMDVGEAILAANAIAAKTTIPMHYKQLLEEGSKDAEDTFKIGVTNSQVVLLEERK